MNLAKVAFAPIQSLLISGAFYKVLIMKDKLLKIFQNWLRDYFQFQHQKQELLELETRKETQKDPLTSDPLVKKNYLTKILHQMDH